MLAPACNIRTNNALLQESNYSCDLYWSPTLPQQPGTSLLAESESYYGGGSLHIYSPDLEILYSTNNIPFAYVSWAGDRSVVTLLAHHQQDHPAILWQPPDSPTTESVLTGQLALQWPAVSRAESLSWSWGEHGGLLVVTEIFGEQVTEDVVTSARVWRHDHEAVEFAAPYQCWDCEWSPCSQRVLLKSWTELTVHCVATGARLLHFLWDDQQPEACALVYGLAIRHYVALTLTATQGQVCGAEHCVPSAVLRRSGHLPWVVADNPDPGWQSQLQAAGAQRAHV